MPVVTIVAHNHGCCTCKIITALKSNACGPGRSGRQAAPITTAQRQSGMDPSSGATHAMAAFAVQLCQLQPAPDVRGPCCNPSSLHTLNSLNPTPPRTHCNQEPLHFPAANSHLVEVALSRLQAGQDRRVQIGGPKAIVPRRRSTHVVRAVAVLAAMVRAQQRRVRWVLQQRLCGAQGDGRWAAAGGEGARGVRAVMSTRQIWVLRGCPASTSHWEGQVQEPRARSPARARLPRHAQLRGVARQTDVQLQGWAVARAAAAAVSWVGREDGCRDPARMIDILSPRLAVHIQAAGARQQGGSAPEALRHMPLKPRALAGARARILLTWCGVQGPSCTLASSTSLLPDAKAASSNKATRVAAATRGAIPTCSECQWEDGSCLS